MHFSQVQLLHEVPGKRAYQEPTMTAAKPTSGIETLPISFCGRCRHVYDSFGKRGYKNSGHLVSPFVRLHVIGRKLFGVYVSICQLELGGKLSIV